MCEEALSFVILRPEATRLVLVGDPKQLPATVLSAAAQRAGFSRSMMDRLIVNGCAAVLLNVQHRMHPDVAKWPNEQFYEGRLVDAPRCVAMASPGNVNVLGGGAFEFLHVDGGSESQDAKGSKFNKTEAAVVRALVAAILKEARAPPAGSPRWTDSPSIGVVTPYRAQREWLASLARLPGVDVNTVDGFQGQERDVIIFTAVRTNTHGGIGFLSNARRLNVALTRARRKVVVVGDASTLGKSNPDWKSLIRDAKLRGCFVVAAADSRVRASVALKAALKEDEGPRLMNTTLERFFADAPWRASFVGVYAAQLRGAGDLQVRREINRKLRGLLKGRWPRRAAREVCLPDVPAARDIFVLRVGEHRVFYTVELWQRGGAAVAVTLVQELRFWAVVRNDAAACARVAGQVVRYREALPERYIDRSRERRRDARDATVTVTLPCEFLAGDDEPSAGARLEQPAADNDPLTNAKCFALSAETARLLVSGDFSERRCAFDLSPEERHLVDVDGGLLLLGRSGTGKTNVLLERVPRRHRNAVSVLDADVEQLVITASPRLCVALEALFNSRAEHFAAPQVDAATHHAPRAKFVTFDELLRSLWRERGGAGLDLAAPFADFWRGLDAGLQRAFPEQLARAEISSRIQGRREALGRGAVSREEYVRGTSRAGALTQRDCERLYEKVYLPYERHKRLAGTRDANDAAHELFRAFTAGGYAGRRYDFVYVDEVQDLTCVQLAILKFVSKTPARFDFAGDTAQTISGACNFRFEELKDLFHHVFSDCSAGRVPPLNTLSRNYRTHAGIVALANRIVGLILDQFPESIDRLPPEASRVGGPKPLFVDSVQAGAGVLELFRNDTAHEFGAEQCILVRTDAEVARLAGMRALTLTILEAKGLEFDDVLVVDFWTSSRFKAWRVLYNFFDGGAAEGKPAFCTREHAGLVDELKLLYVACTRARKRLVFLDSDASLSAPFAALCRDGRLAEFGPISDFFTAAGSTTADEWRAKGAEIFHGGNYREAQKCFRYAGANEWERIAHAFVLKEPPRSAGDAAEAAQIFQSLGLWLEQAECLEALHPADAAAAYLQHAAGAGHAAGQEHASEALRQARKLVVPSLAAGSDEVRLRAAKCSERAALWRAALEQFAALDDWSSCERVVRGANTGDTRGFEARAMDLLAVRSEAAARPERFPAKLVDACELGAASHHAAAGNGPRALEHAGRVMDATARADWLLAHRFWRPLAELHEQQGEHKRAAAVYDERLHCAASAARAQLNAGDVREAFAAMLRHLRAVAAEGPRAAHDAARHDAILDEVLAALADDPAPKRLVSFEALQATLATAPPRDLDARSFSAVLRDAERYAAARGLLDDAADEAAALARTLDGLVSALNKDPCIFRGETAAAEDLDARARVHGLAGDANRAGYAAGADTCARASKLLASFRRHRARASEATDRKESAVGRTSKAQQDVLRCSALAQQAEVTMQAALGVSQPPAGTKQTRAEVAAGVRLNFAQRCAADTRQRAIDAEALYSGALAERALAETERRAAVVALSRVGTELKAAEHDVTVFEARAATVAVARDLLLGVPAATSETAPEAAPMARVGAAGGGAAAASPAVDKALRCLALECFAERALAYAPGPVAYWDAPAYAKDLVALARLARARRALFRGGAAPLCDGTRATARLRLAAIWQHGARPAGLPLLVESAFLAQLLAGGPGGELPKCTAEVRALRDVRLVQRRCRAVLTARQLRDAAAATAAPVPSNRQDQKNGCGAGRAAPAGAQKPTPRAAEALDGAAARGKKHVGKKNKKGKRNQG